MKQSFKICRVATVPFSLYNHLRVQIATTASAGHEVVLISSGGQEVEWLKAAIGVRFHEIDIPRKISLLRDIRALIQLYIFFKAEHFDIVHSTTPKAGMLCAIAAFLARVPVRLHTFTGQVWMELHGIMRWIAKGGDRVTVLLNTVCYADSLSQRDFIASEKITFHRKVTVLGSGSLCGVDLSRFDPRKWTTFRTDIKNELSIPECNKVITFIGRITKDKGIDELLQAFESLRELKCTLILVGPIEAKDGSLSNSVVAQNSDIRMIGYSAEPERYLAITDIFCLPSYREGFPNVVIEAAAMGIPTVGTDIVGLKDAVVDAKTGILVPPKDSQALVIALKVLLTDETLRVKMGDAARARALLEFSSEKVNGAVLDEYEKLGNTHRR